MKGKSDVGISLYMEWVLLMFLAGIVSLLFFWGSRILVEQQIDMYYQSRNMVQSYNEKYISELQEYIQNRGISSKDIHRLDEWMNDNRLVYIQIEKNSKWIYSSDHSMDEPRSDEYDFPVYPKDSYYDIDLKDGTVQVFIMGMYSYNAYMLAMVVLIILAFILFIGITMIGIRRKIHYINQLSNDIEILEGGNLDYEVHVRGNDEITVMAKRLNAMKISFYNQINEVESLTKTNQEMVTEISHDLRTPLTSILLYAEILKEEKYGKEVDRQTILDKMIKKIQHMKELSDGLLAYVVRESEEKYVLAEYMSIHSVLYDELSDMCQYLEEQGVKIKTNLQWQKGKIFLCEEYLMRIMDNISSNILKYADRQEDVFIWDEYDIDEMCIFYQNACIKGNDKQESYNIGIPNVTMMMKEMGGRCDVERTDKRFQICLRFKFRNDE